MKKLLLLIICSINVSCNSQTDLDAIKFDDNVINIIKDIKDVEKTRETNFGLLSYETNELQNFKFGNTSISKYKVPESYEYGNNRLDIHVDQYNSNKYIGITLEITNLEESNKILEYLEQKYGKPEKRYQAGDNNGKAYLWDIKPLKKVILVTQVTEYTRKDKSYLSTRIVVAKKGIRLENSDDSKFPTITDQIQYLHPKLK
ncbi:hypothetical protein [Flavobacterium nitrogenifigens]|uniref:Uncharacterized protein n=1 Tax=Flavobacterium nitrogenifigens TaxID=1617283 RepID=A0A521D0L9_9FLAO|nr:hypothetical protein [Flavobacterium nitrogenifigens]KAF2332802.1 hypothetical protein DM397_10845 [Flavobacterium nitrogenifigens]SMO65245.1 hypothetical protein SAMN06265220_102870 [Flavobacterium nitrogenifigens]